MATPDVDIERRPEVGTRADVPREDGDIPREDGDIPREDENTAVDLARIGWLATVVACLIAVVILSLQGYYGYALVTLAVAISAGINLF
jgi:hypothetical protein